VISTGTNMLIMYQPRLPKLSTSYVTMCIVVPLIPRLQVVCLHLEYAAAAWDPYLAVIVNSWKRYSVGLFVLLNETTDKQHRCLLSFLNLAGKPSPIIGETVACHSCTRVFTVWLVFPPHLFVVLPSPLVQLMATHLVSCPLEPILTSTPSILVPLLTGMPSRHL